MKLRLILKKKTKVPLLSIISVFMFLDLITIGYINSPFYTLIQYISLLAVTIYVTLHCKCIKKVSDVMFLMLEFTVMGCIVISSYLNHVDPALLRGAVYYGALNFIVCILLVEAGNRGMIDEVLFGGKIYLLIVLALNDLLMLVMPGTFYNISGRDIGTTLLGNKFNVAYAHLVLMFLLVFEEKNEKRRNRKVVAYAILLSVVCKFVDCNTTLLACWVFVMLYFLPENLREIASNPITFIVVFFLSGFLLLFFSGILTWTPVRYLIVDILHRDATLTGRMQVYDYIYGIVSQSKWWGYGYYTDIFKKTSMWYANAQNAMWDFIICYGFITMAAMFVYMMSSVCKFFKNESSGCFRDTNWITFSMLYVYVFIGIGEIVYNKQFFFFIALLWAECSTKGVRVRK